MDAEGLTQAPPDTGAWREWLDNLATGLRLAFFRRPVPGRFHVGAHHLVAIVVTCFAVNCAGALVQAGFAGFFNLDALPSTLFWVTLALFAGFLSAQVMNDGRHMLLIPIAVGLISIPLSVATSAIWFAADHAWFGTPTASGLAGLDQLIYAWWAMATLLAVKRLTVAPPGRTVSPVAIVAMFLLVPAYFLPAQSLWEPAFDLDEGAGRPVGTRRVFSEKALYAQPELLRTAVQQLKPERPGVEDLYFVGFAPYAGQDVFMKETLAIRQLLERRFDVGGRAISLISHPDVIDKYPIATLTSLREALRAVGQRINPDEDVVMLHLTSHGSEAHVLSVEFAPLKLEPIRPADVRSALDAAGIKWRIVVVSACYAGGFMDALRDDRTMVVTAADARHTSFGCGNAFDYTYFSKAYFDEALRKTFSFEKAFAMATASIRWRERNEGLEHSNPQMFIGHAMRAKLSQLETRLSARATYAR